MHALCQTSNSGGVQGARSRVHNFLTRLDNFQLGFSKEYKVSKDKISHFFDFTVVFNELVLEAQTELDNVLGY